MAIAKVTSRVTIVTPVWFVSYFVIIANHFEFNSKFELKFIHILVSILAVVH